MKKVSYNNAGLRIIASVLFGLFITIHGRWSQLGRALLSPSFYVFLAISFAIGLILLYVIHRTTIWLDGKWGWYDKPLLRLILQLMLGVVIPVTADIVIIALYCLSLGLVDNFVRFVREGVPIVLAGTVLFNLYYIFRYIKVDRNYTTTPMGEQPLKIDHGGVFILLNVGQEVLHFFRIDRKVFAFTVHGEEYALKETLAQIQDQYQTNGFCRINRSVIINLRTVQGFHTGLKRDTYHLFFKPEYQNIASKSNPEIFLVTKDRKEAFKTLFEQK